MSIRAFIALDIPETVKKELATLITSLRKIGSDVKWTDPKDIHITLKFLGQVKDQEVEEIKRVLNRITRQQRSFSIHFATLGGFPTLERPRVLWVGIDQGTELLEEFVEKTGNGLAALGFPKEERSFSAHVTLGRVRSNRNLRELVDTIKGITFVSARQVKLDRLVLYKSTLTREGAIHEVITQLNLR